MRPAPRLVGAALLAVTAAALAAIAPAAGAADPQAEGVGAGVGLTVLLFHPDDGVDPFGIPYEGSDPFAVRYGPLVAEKGRFDFPFFVADGVLPIETIPDPGRPFASARASYDQAIAERLQVRSPVTLVLDSLVAGRQVVASVSIEPHADLADEDLHLWLAVAEDHVEYQPPPGLTNGVTDHRFTVRDVRDLGAVDFSSPAASTSSAGVDLTATFLLDDGWQRSELSLAAWLQQDAPSPRFDAREVVQATHAPLGDRRAQATKGVLAEMLSATWCEPCLYGDAAIEDIAVARGIAQPGESEPASRYLEWAPRDGLAIAVAAAAGVALVAAARRRP
ncbi:MAG TPA: hypothetical protein VM327_06145 [Candidatus Thermoplasmatota archaeon]|nr:hypothetical protein [Candidatus Thermoplasmatota archaeon]